MSKRHWYTKGVDAASTVFPDAPKGYICPLCGDIFPSERIGDLSREHVPPKALGGTVLLLTCRLCNNVAGSVLDHHAVTNRRVRDLLDGKMTDASDSVPGRSYLEGGYRIQGELRNTGEGIRPDGLLQIVGPPLPDTPTVSLHGNFRRWQLPSGDPTRETVSWLKSSYLVAFAAFGYSYLILPGLDHVRGWIHQPESAKGQIYHLHVDGIPKNQQRLIVIPADAPVQAIAVQFGTRVMFLPGTVDGGSFYDRLNSDEFRNQLMNSSMVAKLIDWPTEPMHQLDIGPAENTC